MGDAVAMTDEDVLTAKSVSSAVTGSLEGLLVALQEEIASTIHHVLALTVEIGSGYMLATSHGHALVAFRPAATIVPRHKEIVPATMLIYKRCLNGIWSGKL